LLKNQAGGHGERVGEAFDLGERRVHRAAFDGADMADGNAACLGKLPQRHRARPSKRPDLGADGRGGFGDNGANGDLVVHTGFSGSATMTQLRRESIRL
jgi:hypothetical protein